MLDQIESWKIGYEMLGIEIVDAPKSGAALMVAAINIKEGE